MPEAPSNHYSSSATRCLSLFEFQLRRGPYLEPALEACCRYGGITAVANIALSAFRCCTMTEAWIGVIRQHMRTFSVFALFPRRVADEFSEAIHELDGVPILVEGLVRLTTQFGGRLHMLGLMGGVDSILLCLIDLFRKSHRNVEQAARCGLLGLLPALNQERPGLSEGVPAISTIVLMLPHYFVYHSVTKVFGEEMRKFTEGEEIIRDPSEGNLALATKYRNLKRLLIDKYCIMRFYDIVVAPSLKTKYCNSVRRSYTLCFSVSKNVSNDVR